MTKNFSEWNLLKQAIQDTPMYPIFRAGEIWWGSIGLNIGSEEDGKNALFERPILILRKYSRELFLGVPLTSKVKEGKNFYRVSVAGTTRSLILSQSRSMSAKRLQRKLYHLSDPIFEDIGRAFMALTLEKPQQKRFPSTSEGISGA